MSNGHSYNTELDYTDIAYRPWTVSLTPMIIYYSILQWTLLYFTKIYYIKNYLYRFYRAYFPTHRNSCEIEEKNTQILLYIEIKVVYEYNIII